VHIALLTEGRYIRLEVDHNSTGRAMFLAVRDTDLECPVETLSEGTRDQLYLALRTAIVAAHATKAEPLPFIADDLLVHFDDRRAAAALALLARLGQTTQVILFTHHGHIAALAAKQAGVAVQHLPGLIFDGECACHGRCRRLTQVDSPVQRSGVLSALDPQQATLYIAPRHTISVWAGKERHAWKSGSFAILLLWRMVGTSATRPGS
jgi:hypothetical protein